MENKLENMSIAIDLSPFWTSSFVGANLRDQIWGAETSKMTFKIDFFTSNESMAFETVELFGRYNEKDHCND